MVSRAPIGPDGRPIVTAGAGAGEPLTTVQISELYLSFPAQFTGSRVWEAGEQYIVNGARQTLGPNSGFSFQGDVTQLNPALDAADQELVYSANFNADGQTTMDIQRAGIQPGNYVLKLWSAQFNGTPRDPRRFSVSVNGGPTTIIDLSGTNLARAHQESVTIADLGGGSGNLQVLLTALDDFPTICALSLEPFSNQAPNKPTVTATTLSYHEIRVDLSPGSDDQAVITREIYRDDGGAKTLVQTLAGSINSWTDVGLARDTQYTYTCIDYDSEPLASAESDPAVTSTFADIRINIGGPLIIDNLGLQWSQDTDFSGGAADPTALSGTVGNTVRPQIYYAQRFGGTITYTIAIPDGEVRFIAHFAETDPNQVVGGRVIKINVDGQTLISDFDVFAEAGYKTALIKSAPQVTTGGSTVVTFAPVAGTPEVAALELIANIQPPQNLVPANIGETSFDVSCDAVVDAVEYIWSVNGAQYALTTTPNVSITNRLPDTQYDVTVVARDSHPSGPFTSADSATLQVTTLAQAAPTIWEPTGVDEQLPDLYVVEYEDPMRREQEDQIRAEAQGNPIMLSSFVGADNLSRVTVKQGDEVVPTVWDRFTAQLFDPADKTTVLHTYDTSDPNDAPYMSNDAGGLYVQFGRKTLPAPITPGTYAVAYTVFQTGVYDNGWRIDGEAELTVSAK